MFPVALPRNEPYCSVTIGASTKLEALAATANEASAAAKAIAAAAAAEVRMITTIVVVAALVIASRSLLYLRRTLVGSASLRPSAISQ